MSSIQNATICVLVTLALLSSTGAQQRPAPVPKAEAERPNAWLAKAEYFTAQISEEEGKVTTALRPVLLARLAVAWYKTDPTRARNWLKEAVVQLETVPQNESAEDNRARLRAADAIAPLAAQVDRQCSQKLLAIVRETAEQLQARRNATAGAGDNRERTLDWLSVNNAVWELADSLVKENPKEAAEVLRTFIHLGHGTLLPSFLAEIHRRDPAAGNALFRESLAAARNDADTSLIFGLVQSVTSEGADKRVPPEYRRQVAELITEALVRPPASEVQARWKCDVAANAISLRAAFTPQQRGIVEPAIKACADSKADSLRRMEHAEQFRERSTISFEELFRIAADEPDAKRRGDLKTQAVLKLGDKDVLRSLELLDSFSREEREASAIWAGWREQFARQAIRELHKKRDYQGIQQVLDRTPPKTLAMLLISVAESFQRDDRTFAILMADQARRVLQDAPSDQAGIYERVMNTYARLVPEQAAVVLREAVVGLNGIKPPDKPTLPSAADLKPVTIAAPLLELEDSYLRSIVDELGPLHRRMSFRLGFLQAALDRHQQEEKRRKAKTGTQAAND